MSDEEIVEGTLKEIQETYSAARCPPPPVGFDKTRGLTKNINNNNDNDNNTANNKQGA